MFSWGPVKLRGDKVEAGQAPTTQVQTSDTPTPNSFPRQPLANWEVQVKLWKPLNIQRFFQNARIGHLAFRRGDYEL